MKIVVGGQINKQEIHDYIQKYFGEGNVELAVKNDLDAVMAMKAGQFDYYIGASKSFLTASSTFPSPKYFWI